jgi:hypothetical protein
MNNTLAYLKASVCIQQRQMLPWEPDLDGAAWNPSTALLACIVASWGQTIRIRCRRLHTATSSHQDINIQ